MNKENAVYNVPTLLSQEGNRLNFNNDTNIGLMHLFMIPNSVWNDKNFVEDLGEFSLAELTTRVLNASDAELAEVFAELEISSVEDFYALWMTIFLFFYKEKNS